MGEMCDADAMRAGEMSAGSCWKGMRVGRWWKDVPPAIGISLGRGQAVSSGCLAVTTRPLPAPYEFGPLSPTP
jgi:hypothetical protein